MHYINRLRELLRHLPYQEEAVMHGVEDIVREWRLSGCACEDFPLHLSDLDNRLVPNTIFDEVRDAYVPTGIQLLDLCMGGMRRAALHKILSDDYILANDLLLNLALNMANTLPAVYFSFMNDKGALGERVRRQASHKKNISSPAEWPENEAEYPFRNEECPLKFYVRNCSSTKELIHRIIVEKNRSKTVLFYLESPEVIFSDVPAMLRNFLVKDMYAELRKCALQRDLMIVLSSFEYNELPYREHKSTLNTLFHNFRFNAMESDSVLCVEHSGRDCAYTELISVNIWHSGVQVRDTYVDYLIHHQSSNCITDLSAEHRKLLSPEDAQLIHREWYPFLFQKESEQFK